MPRLTSKIEAAKQAAATEQILALLEVTPIQISQAEIDLLGEEHDDEDYSFEPGPEPVKRHKLHSQSALKFQVAVYRRYAKGAGIREIARGLNRSVSSVQRALDSAIALVGDPRKAVPTPAVLFAGIESCSTCMKGQGAFGRWCKKHDRQLAELTGTRGTYLREKQLGAHGRISAA